MLGNAGATQPASAAPVPAAPVPVPMNIPAPKPVTHSTGCDHNPCSTINKLRITVFVSGRTFNGTHATATATAAANATTAAANATAAATNAASCNATTTADAGANRHRAHLLQQPCVCVCNCMLTACSLVCVTKRCVLQPQMQQPMMQPQMGNMVSTVQSCHTICAPITLVRYATHCTVVQFKVCSCMQLVCSQRAVSAKSTCGGRGIVMQPLVQLSCKTQAASAKSIITGVCLSAYADADVDASI